MEICILFYSRELISGSKIEVTYNQTETIASVLHQTGTNGSLKRYSFSATVYFLLPARRVDGRFVARENQP